MKIEKINTVNGLNNQFFNNPEVTEMGFEELFKNILSNCLINTETSIEINDKKLVNEDTNNTVENVVINTENKQGMILTDVGVMKRKITVYEEIGEIGEVDVGVSRYELGKTISNQGRKIDFKELIDKELEEGLLTVDILDKELVKEIVTKKEFNPYIVNGYIKSDKELEKEETKNELDNEIQITPESNLQDVFKQFNFSNIVQLNFEDTNKSFEVVNDDTVKEIVTKNYNTKDDVDFNYSNVKLNYDLGTQDKVEDKSGIRFGSIKNGNYDFGEKSQFIGELSTHNEKINLNNNKDTNNFISLDTVKNKITDLVKQFENDNNGTKNNENKNGIDLIPRFLHQNVDIKIPKYTDVSEIEENLMYLTKYQDTKKDNGENLEYIDVNKNILQDNDINQRKYIKHDFDVIGLKQEEHNVSRLSDIVNIVASKIKNLKNENITELKVTLKPRELGEIVIKVIYNEGSIEGTITANNKEVANVLQNNINNLKEQIKQNDIQFKEININVKTDDNPKEKNNQENRKQQRKQNKEIFKLDEDKLDGITL